MCLCVRNVDTIAYTSNFTRNVLIVEISPVRGAYRHTKEMVFCLMFSGGAVVKELIDLLF